MMKLIRVLDLLGALVGIVVTGPVMFCAALAIWVESGSPVLFTQDRVGQNNTLFRIYKFRSMYVGTPDVAKDKLAAQMTSRVTTVGRFVRRTSIDELPQLFNVLKGEMSLVGPRPALYNQADLIELRTAAGVERMRPGLTGLAQVMGREDMSVEQKVDFDKQLLHTYNLGTYLYLIFRTVGVVFSPRGTY